MAVMLPNCPQSIISYYGVLFAGGIVVQTNPLYTEHELEYQLRDAEARMIITLDLLFPKAIKMKTLSIVNQILVTSIKDYLPFPKIFSIRLRKNKKCTLTMMKTTIFIPLLRA